MYLHVHTSTYSVLRLLMCGTACAMYMHMYISVCVLGMKEIEKLHIDTMELKRNVEPCQHDQNEWDSTVLILLIRPTCISSEFTL